MSRFALLRISETNLIINVHVWQPHFSPVVVFASLPIFDFDLFGAIPVCVHLNSIIERAAPFSASSFLININE